MGGDEHRDSIVRLYDKIVGVTFDWNILPPGWQKFAEGVVFVDNAVGGKKGIGGTHYRNPMKRTKGWSWPDLDVAYRELCISIDEENKFRRYGAFFHLYVDCLFLSVYLPESYPRTRDEANGIDVVYFRGRAFETDVFKEEILYPSYAAHQRIDESKMEECLLHMPDEFTPFGRFAGTKDGWKETVRSYFDKHSTIYPDGPLAFTPGKLEMITESAVDAFIAECPEIVDELRSLTA